MTKVSIIIPCYNGGDMVQTAVASALSQSHPQTEVVVVDDGSTDLETLRALDRTEIVGGARVIRQSNIGLSGARNRGIEESTGDFILPLDHDDEIHADYAAKAARVLDAQPDVAIVYARAERFGATTGEWDLPEFSMTAMLARNVIHACAMFRRSDWRAVGGYSQELRRGYEDYDFWLKLLGLGRDVVRIDEILFRYRDTGRSMASAMTHQDRVEAFAHIFAMNSSLYVQHADAFAEVLVGQQQQWDMLAHFKRRYGRVEDAISRIGAWHKRRAGRS